MATIDPIYPEGCAVLFQEPFEWPLVGGMRDGWFEGIPYPPLAGVAKRWISSGMYSIDHLVKLGIRISSLIFDGAAQRTLHALETYVPCYIIKII